MEQNIVNNFAIYAKKVGCTQKQRDLLTSFFISCIREDELSKKVSDMDYESYCDQIIQMISENPDLSRKTFIDYITLVFSKIQKKTKVIKIS